MALNPLYINMLSRLDDYINDLSKYISLSLLCSYFPGTSPLAQSCVGWKLDPAIHGTHLRLSLVLWLVELLLFTRFRS